MRLLQRARLDWDIYPACGNSLKQKTSPFQINWKPADCTDMSGIPSIPEPSFSCGPRRSSPGMALALRLAFTLYFIIGGMVEEKRLVAEFGDAYRVYRMRTPMLIPGLKKHI